MELVFEFGLVWIRIRIPRGKGGWMGNEFILSPSLPHAPLRGVVDVIPQSTRIGTQIHPVLVFELCCSDLLGWCG